MRGKADALFELFQLGGITPACAGKSYTAFVQKAVYRDHPRVCGEKFLLPRG